MKKRYRVSSKVWLYPGMSGWHFVNVPKTESSQIKKDFNTLRRGFGSIPVEVSLGKTKWKTSIFPDKRSGTYLLPLKRDVREREDVFLDEIITFSITLIP